MSKSINKSVVLPIASFCQNLVGLLSLDRACNKCVLFESESRANAYRPSVYIINIIINVMPMPIKPMAINSKLMGKWHKLASRLVGKVNI